MHNDGAVGDGIREENIVVTCRGPYILKARANIVNPASMCTKTASRPESSGGR